MGVWIGLVGIAVYSTHTPNQEAARSILSTLARVQAGIFAIVFSIVILGVRLSASRYSPRLAKSFSSDSTYRVTVGIFAFSIAIDILGLYIAGVVSDTTLRVVLASSGVLAGGSFVSLYGFVNQILERTTPEGIFSHIKDDLTPKSMLEEADLSAGNPAHPDPFQTLTSVINSTIEDHDRASSALGLSILGDRVAALIDYDGVTKDDTPVDQTIEYVCEDQIPRILEHAVDEDLNETAIESTETSETIGEAAIRQKSDLAVEHAVRGQAGLIDTLPYEASVERVRTAVIDISQELVDDAAENQLYTGAAIGTRFLGWKASSSIMDREIDDGRNYRYTTLLTSHFPSLISTIANSNVQVDDRPRHQWFQVTDSKYVEPSSPAERLISSSYGSMGELTSAAIRYEVRTGQKIVRWESVASGWSSGLDSLIQMDLDVMAQLWYGTSLYLEYISRESSSEVMDGYSSYGRHRVTRDVGEETVEKILDGRLDPTSRIDYVPARVDPVKNPLTGFKRPPLENPDRTFKQWVDDQPFIYRRKGFGSVDEPSTDEDSSQEEHE